MPNDPVVWIILIVVVGAVVALAIWFGRGIRFKKDDKGLEIKVAGEAKPGKQPDEITSVAENVAIGKNAEVGDIAGTKVRGAHQEVQTKAKTEVFKGGEVGDGAKVGDIVGKKIED